jgi:hypothetical protein
MRQLPLPLALMKLTKILSSSGVHGLFLSPLSQHGALPIDNGQFDNPSSTEATEDEEAPLDGTALCRAAGQGTALQSVALLRKAPHNQAWGPPNPTTPWWKAVPRRRPWRDSMYCCATVSAAAEKGYFDEFVSLRVYFLNSFRFWVISV